MTGCNGSQECSNYIKKLDAKISEIRSQTAETFGIKIGGSLFECLERAGRLSDSRLASIPNDPCDKELSDVVEIKILDCEHYVYRVDDDTFSIEIAPRSDCLVYKS